MGTPLGVTDYPSLSAFNILSVFNLYHFIYDVSLFGSVCIHLDWDSLCFLNSCDFFHQQVKVVFSRYFFKQVLYTLLTLFFSWHTYKLNVFMFGVVPEVP